MTRVSKLIIVSVVWMLATFTAFGQNNSTPQPSDTKTEVTAAMRSIRSASAAGEVDQWQSLVADKCIFIEPTGRRASRSWHIPSKAAIKSAVQVKVDIGNIAVEDFGSTAVLTYVETTQAQVGDNSIRTVTRFTETYQRAPKGWQMVASAETPVPQRTAIKIDPKLLDDYLGEYQVAPNLIGTVFRQGDKLMLIGTGWKQPYELVPLAKDSFFVKEFENTEIVFVRDNNGKVIEHMSRTDGHDMVAPKVNK
jgi:hypothetical protein